jgi:hypothetical protein
MLNSISYVAKLRGDGGRGERATTAAMGEGDSLPEGQGEDWGDSD